jgi:hypothetical protein
MEPLTGTVAELWRWPVLGMAPERLRAARLGRRGMAGDGIHLVMAGEEVLEAGALAGWSAEYPFNVDSAIDPEHPPQALVIPPDRMRRWRWGDPQMVRALGEAIGRPVELRREPTRASPILLSAQPGVPVHLRLAFEAPPERLAGHEIAFDSGVRLEVTGPAGARGGIEARVLTGGRVAVGWSFTLS